MLCLARQILATILSLTIGISTFTYDAVGNRTQKVSTLPGYPGGLSNYNANDQLSTDAYDADGNTVGSGANTGTNGYVYDFENHLIKQGGISIVYDGDGNRVSKTVAGVTTLYLVDDQNPTGYAQVVAEEAASTSPLATYSYGLEQVVRYRQFRNSGGLLVSETVYYVHDGHGSVRALTDQSGAVTDTYDYDAFGNLIHSSGTTPNNYLFAGEQFDPDLNLYYNRARYLNTGTGRFGSMDTDEGDDASPLSLHKYIYTNADPVDGTDPSGFQDSLAELGAEESMSTTLDAMPQIQAVKPSFEKCWLTGSRCTKNQVIFSAVEEAWLDSYPASPMRHEEGGWIYEATAKGDNTIKVTRAPRGSGTTIDLKNPPSMSGYLVIANFHTHPNPSSEHFRQSESDQDAALAIKRNVPGVLRSELGITWYGPIRRGANPELAAPGPVDGYPGNKSDTRYCN
jgi:RHS repeat-associated protein